MTIWHTVKGYVAAGVAFIACPCHLPLTLPLILALTAGTAFGAWLAANKSLLYGVSTILFLSGLVLAGKWLAVDVAKTCPVSTQEKQPTKL